MNDLERWVQEQFEEGHSPDEIRQSIKESGQDPGVVDEVLGEDRDESKTALYAAAGIVILIVVISAFFFSGDDGAPMTAEILVRDSELWHSVRAYVRWDREGVEARMEIREGGDSMLTIYKEEEGAFYTRLNEGGDGEEEVWRKTRGINLKRAEIRDVILKARDEGILEERGRHTFETGYQNLTVTVLRTGESYDDELFEIPEDARIMEG